MLSLSELQPFLEPALEELGLTEYEMKLYFLSLSLGPLPIAAFAKHLGISRPNVYKVILGLEKRGLASFSHRESRSRTFIVESPNVLLQRLKEKRERIEKVDSRVMSALPDLLALYQQGDRATAIKVFDTEKKWVEIFFQVLTETKGDYLFFGNVEKFLALAPGVQQRWVEERIKRGIFGKLLTLPSVIAKEKSKNDKQELRETRFLPGTESFETSFLIFGKKVIIWQPKAPLAVLIEDEYIVQMLRSIFSLLWKSAESFIN
ncbi:hypothetical protein FJZ48_02415 [Candidatus Uhrbacteria bacterium]|nr:hypothetical protein [Candidatus Uhrbacteria bacterium]